MRVSDSVLTEIFEGLLDLFSGQVEVDVGWDERCVEPVVVVISVYCVSSQLIMRQLLLKQTDDFHLRKIRAVTHIWQRERECKENGENNVGHAQTLLKITQLRFCIMTVSEVPSSHCICNKKNKTKQQQKKKKKIIYNVHKIHGTRMLFNQSFEKKKENKKEFW